MIHGAQQNYGSSFLPAKYQGTAVGDFKVQMTQAKIRNLSRAEPTEELQRLQLDFLQAANRRHAADAASDLRLEGRIEAFELAFRMQMEAPQVLDSSGETQATYDM